MRTNTESEVQDWIRCPDCGSEGAVLTVYPQDRDGNLHCPDCEARLWEVPHRASPRDPAYD